MENSKYKIGIVGLGPVGSTLAVHFHLAGCYVAICDFDKEKINLIRNHGIKLVNTIEKSTFFEYAYSSVEELLNHELDILICAVKAYHIGYLLEQIETSGRKDLLILSAQNGIDIGKMYLSHFDESMILRMVINFAGNHNAPNVTNVTFFNPPNFVASLDDSRQDVSDWICNILTSANLETKSVDSFLITEKIWEKTILNAALSPICAIAKLTMKEAMSIPHTSEIVEQLILEAVEVASTEGIKFGDNFVKLCLRYLKKAGDHFPSLAVDLLNNRETEIDFMNGKIVDYGKKHYVRTPLNLTLTNLVRAISDKNSNLQKSTLVKQLKLDEN